MDKITQARYNFVLAFQYCSNGKDFPVFRTFRVGENERIHTGYDAIDLLDKALKLKPDFQEARQLRGDIWHAILTKNRDDNYQIYLKSDAWTDTRKKFFEQVGALCICGGTATQLHHKTYENIGKEDILKDLVGLCDECHSNYPPGKEYWDRFKSYVKERGYQLQLFPEPDLPSFYGIQIHEKTRKTADIFKEGAIWLVAYRSAHKLQARLYVRSSTHYSALKGQEAEIKEKVGADLDELIWPDNKRPIRFSNDTVGHVSIANKDQEFSWLHDRLVRLHKVFRPRVSAL